MMLPKNGIDVLEDVRIYYFPNHETVVLNDVRKLAVQPSGNHRLKTKDGILHIVHFGWLHIAIKSMTGEWQHGPTWETGDDCEE